MEQVQCTVRWTIGLAINARGVCLYEYMALIDRQLSTTLPMCIHRKSFARDFQDLSTRACKRLSIKVLDTLLNFHYHCYANTRPSHPCVTVRVPSMRGACTPRRTEVLLTPDSVLLLLTPCRRLSKRHASQRPSPLA